MLFRSLVAGIPIEKGGRYQGDAAYFCTCDDGIKAEAGMWFDIAFPAGRTGQRHGDQKGRDAFADWLRAHPERYYLRDAVEQLRIQWKESKSRDLQSVYD